MRKIFTAVLAAAAALLTACGGSENSVVAESSRGVVFAYSSSSASESAPPPVTSADKEDSMDTALNIEITVNGQTFSAELFDNETAKAFKERLPLTLDMIELNGNEKYYNLSGSLPTDSSRPSAIHTGDIMLYGNNCLVIFYEDFRTTYSYTPIGKINAPEGLAAALGSGDVSVKFN